MKKIVVGLLILVGAFVTNATTVNYKISAMKGETVLQEVTVKSRIEVDHTVTSLSERYPQAERIEIEPVAAESINL